VYENAHRVSEDVTLQHGELKTMNKNIGNHKYLSHSKQKTESSCSPSQNPLPIYDKLERDVQVLDPKGLIGKYLETQDLDTT
jgi:hypothetical protein